MKLDFKPGTVIRFDEKEYHFLQAHFHTPSEHQVDGIPYPMEIHFVCMTLQQDENKDPGYLVVADFFRMGVDNKFIQAFMVRVPKTINDTAYLKGDPVYVSDFLRPEEPFNDFYYYRGSLTTPPYNESVN